MTVRTKFLIKLFSGLIIFILVYALLLGLLKNFGITTEDIKAFVDKSGPLGFFVLIFLMMLSVMSPFPDTPVALVANVLYGPILGFIIVIFGSLSGAVIDFYLVRRLGRKFFQNKFPHLYLNVNHLSSKIGFEALVFLRIFPTVTFDIVSYAAALTKIKFKVFIIATLTGLFPLALTYSIVGRGIESDNITTLTWSLILGLVVILVTIGISKKFDKKLKLNELEDDDII